MADIVYKHSAGGLVFKDKKVLLIHWEPPRSSYDFPKGTIEAGETPDVTCVREVFEETGYHVNIIAPLGQTQYEYVWTDDNIHKKTVDYYLLELADDTRYTPARELYETFENIWLDPQEALQLLTRDVDKAILQKALDMRLVGVNISH